MNRRDDHPTANRDFSGTSRDEETHATTAGAAAAGAVTGGVIGLAGGPVGAAIGALGGAIVGAAAERLMHGADGDEDWREPTYAAAHHTPIEQRRN